MFQLYPHKIHLSLGVFKLNYCGYYVEQTIPLSLKPVVHYINLTHVSNIAEVGNNICVDGLYMMITLY